ncbi:MAG TPA: hypothetical protein VGO47_00800, partial [Chlamydiales bacterium]|nr:hypothetical protein [Chlamydiales bacterium]
SESMKLVTRRLWHKLTAGTLHTLVIEYWPGCERIVKMCALQLQCITISMRIFFSFRAHVGVVASPLGSNSERRQRRLDGILIALYTSHGQVAAIASMSSFTSAAILVKTG